MLDSFFTCKMWRHKTFRLTNCLIFALVMVAFAQRLLWVTIAFIDHFRHIKKSCQPLNVIVLVLIWIIMYYIGKGIEHSVMNIITVFCWKYSESTIYQCNRDLFIISSKIVNCKSHFNCVSYAIMVTIMNAFISLFKCNMPFWMLKCFYNLHVNALLHLMFVVGN